MKKKKFDSIIDKVWENRKKYTRLSRENEWRCEFDSPEFGGAAKLFKNASPEVIGAMQAIWPEVINSDGYGKELYWGDFRTKREFKRAYKMELKTLGELVK